jgi:hypothetical protein
MAGILNIGGLIIIGIGGILIIAGIPAIGALFMAGNTELHINGGILLCILSGKLNTLPPKKFPHSSGKK